MNWILIINIIIYFFIIAAAIYTLIAPLFIAENKIYTKNKTMLYINRNVETHATIQGVSEDITFEFEPDSGNENINIFVACYGLLISLLILVFFQLIISVFTDLHVVKNLLSILNLIIAFCIMVMIIVLIVNVRGKLIWLGIFTDITKGVYNYKTNQYDYGTIDIIAPYKLEPPFIVMLVALGCFILL